MRVARGVMAWANSCTAKLQEGKKSAVESELNKAKAQFERKTNLLRETAELKSRIGVIGGEIEKLERKGVEGKPAILKAMEQSKALLKARKKLEQEASDKEGKARDVLVNLESDVKSAARESEERDRLRKEYAGKDRKRLEEAISSANGRLKLLRETHGTNLAARNDGEKWLRELEGHDGKCPLCERELAPDARSRMLEDKRKIVKQLDVAIARNGNELAALEKSHDEDSKELQRIVAIEERLAQYKDIDARLAKGRERLAKAQEESERLRAAKESASDAVSKTKERLLEIESKRDSREAGETYGRAG